MRQVIFSKIRSFFTLFLGVLGVLCLSSCSNYGPRFQTVPYHLVGGSVVKADYQSFYRALLRKRGIWINRTGETIRLSFPSLFVFREGTANFVSGSRPMLNDVAALLASYQVELMKVNAYSDVRDQRMDRIVLALMNKRAQRVSAYLHESGYLDTRMITASGHVKHSLGQALQPANRLERIDIVFRYDPSYRSYL